MLTAARWQKLTEWCLDSSWLDAPRGRRFNRAVEWFIAELPVRAQRVVLKAALGELYKMPAPTATLREFIALPTRTLLLADGYEHKTHKDICRTLRDLGVTGQLFSGDEERLPRL